MQGFYHNRRWIARQLIALFVLTCCSVGVARGQEKPDYAPPIKGPLLVTGTFGELRSDHFHAGIDLRAAIGTPVYSVAAGYVSRIKISAGGYGQAVYVDHPGGYRSVYGHLDALRADLLDTVRATQYAQQRFAVDLRFDSLAFPVQRSERLGEVGNRGFSFGPHLHFEIRAAETDAPLNPLAFGINVPDTRKPDLRKIKLYELQRDGTLAAERELQLQKSREGYYTVPGVIEVNSQQLGLAIKAYDRQNAMPNYNGIYAAELWQDTVLLHRFRFDSIPFEETRYLNAHTDYAAWNGQTSWFHRLHCLPGDQLCIYDQRIGALELPAGQDEPATLEVRVYDWAGNVSLASLTMRYRAAPPPQNTLRYQYHLLEKEGNIIDNGQIRLEFPAGALYTDCYLRYHNVVDRSEGIYSAVHHLHDPLTPLHRPAMLTIEANQPLDSSLLAHYVVARCSFADDKDRPVNCGPAFSATGEPAAVPIWSFGDYCILLDTIPPSIEPLRFRRKLGSMSRISFRIQDNFSTAGKARGLRHSAWIDGAWVLMEYDLKKDEIFYDFQTPLAPGKHRLEIQVRDDRGNEAWYQTTIRP